MKTQISLGPVWSESSLLAWRHLGSLATHWEHSEDWSDWVDAYADLSLRWAHTHFVGFVMSWLIWRNHGSLATRLVHSKDSDQTVWMRRLIRVFTGRTSFRWLFHAAAKIKLQGDYFSKNKFPGCSEIRSQIVIICIIKPNFWWNLCSFDSYILSNAHKNKKMCHIFEIFRALENDSGFPGQPWNFRAPGHPETGTDPVVEWPLCVLEDEFDLQL